VPSIHYVPYCQTKNKFSQDQIHNMPNGLKCPGCGLIVTNEDVIDCTPLQYLVSIVRSRGSKMGPGLWS
jgi:hypothetical protein